MTETDVGPGAPRRQAAATPHASDRASRRPDIEGLRGVAVALVVGYHLGVPLLPGGFIGVDVFFVISGFLITGLLLAEIDRTGTISLRRFYARRARRLLPAASVVLVVTAAAGWWVLPGSQHENLGRDVVASATYLINWELADRSVDYLAEGDAASPLQHYWSLAVEEQFYVVWPLLALGGLALARRRGVRPRPVLLAAVAAAGGASLVWSVIATASDPARAYFVSTTRMWELAVGAVLAFVLARAPRLAPGWVVALAWSGGVAVLTSGVVVTTATPWPGWAALFPVFGTVALIAAGGSAVRTTPSRLLSARPLTALGGISYAVYLWHWPLIVLTEARWGPPGAAGALALVAVTVVLASGTGRLVERPVRFGRLSTAAPRASLLLAVGATVAVVSLGAGVVASVPEAPAGRPSVAGAGALVANPRAEKWEVVDEPSRVYTRSGTLVPDPAVAPDDDPRFPRCVTPTADDEPRSGCDFGDRQGDERVVLLGDSKMEQWFPAVNSVAKREGWRLRLLLKSACAFSQTGVPADCAGHTGNVLEQLTENPPDRALISQRIAGSYDDAEGGLTGAVGELVELGIDVIVVADNPSPPVEAVYACVELHPSDYRTCAFDRSEAVATSGLPQLTRTAADLDLPVLDLNEWICPAQVAQCPAAIAGALVYRQGSHLTDTYVRTLTPMFHRALTELGWARTPVDRIRLRVGF